jgi:hypothetical protein
MRINDTSILRGNAAYISVKSADYWQDRSESLKIIVKNKLAWNLGFAWLLYLYGLFIMIKKTAWFIFFALLASACLDEPDCFNLNNNIVGIAFKRMSTNRADTVFFRSIKAEGTETVFLNNTAGTGVSGINSLPLNYYQNETTFHFDGIDKVYDLKLGYSAKAQFVSKDCGERFVLTGLNPIASSFDSVRVVNTIPKAGNATDIQLEIFRCPNTSRIKIKFSAAVEITEVRTDYQGSLVVIGANTALVPLDVNASQSAIHFKFKDNTTKDLVLSYNRQTHNLFHACGKQIVLSDFVVDKSKTTFPTVNVIRTVIQDPPLTNLEIIL